MLAVWAVRFPLLAAPDREVLLQCMAVLPQFTQEEKDALAADAENWSRFGAYAVTANAKRASGVALAEDGPLLEKVSHAMEMRAIAAFGNVFPQWQEEYDRLDAKMSQAGRFPAIRQRRVFYGKVEPKALARKMLQLADGNVLVLLQIPADKVTIDRGRYEAELRKQFSVKLLELYAQFRQQGDLRACASLEDDLRLVGAKIPDDAIHDYMQALSNDDDSVAATLIEEIASTFRELPDAMQQALLRVISTSRRKDDCRLLEEKQIKTHE